MKKLFSILLAGFMPFLVYAQAGHIMQGIGAHNMSMGGAATAQPLDISGALHWNPASISAFDKKIFSANAGFFFSSPELSSTVPTPGGPMSGTTKDDRGVSVMPALAMVWGKKDSKHTLGVSAFGISGFGVTFPESSSNPINMPQTMGGFGKLLSDYQLMQVGVTYAYKLNPQFSIGVAPTFNYSALKLEPNPLASPSPTKGYPVSERASALGFGGQVGLFYNSGKGIKLGVSYKTQQSFKEFKFKSKYLDGSTAPEVKFKMNYPAILSFGAGYSNDMIDIAADYRFVNYEKTDGFEAKGWTSTASVKGFGWKNMSVISAGIQYKGIKKLPLRVGYTYSGCPIESQLAFFSTPATAIIKNAFQFGFGYEASKHVTLNAVYHHGSSGDGISGPLLSPMMVSASNPYGAVPSSSVSYKMTTDLIMFGINYTF
ncbi:MAG TPA: outer membrane protein transport protein [Chitinophagaceae bacterium]|jgi:long-chain fatty acid transport protein|nr:outer membrane protein transport protein [Chitinophagaceae bacterium]HMU59689.1 outer membrane protein transport protein [Chitinophagaceae bacterium]